MEFRHSANIFRLSAILYASNNYQISPVQLHKKIIEDALYTNNSTNGISIESLAQYIGPPILLHLQMKNLEKYSITINSRIYFQEYQLMEEVIHIY